MRTIQGNIIPIAQRSRDIIGHQTNCQRQAGAGLAQAIALKWPDWWTDFRKTKGRLGDCHIWYVGNNPNMPGVASLYGQDRCGRERDHDGNRKQYTDYAALETAMAKLAAYQRVEMPHKQIYLPVGIGCGLGGGTWADVLEIIERTLPQAILVEYKR